MAWVAVNEDGSELMLATPPDKLDLKNYKQWVCFGNRIFLPQGSIEKLIGRSLTWNDNPVELK